MSGDEKKDKAEEPGAETTGEETAGEETTGAETTGEDKPQVGADEQDTALPTGRTKFVWITFHGRKVKDRIVVNHYRSPYAEFPSPGSTQQVPEKVARSLKDGHKEGVFMDSTEEEVEAAVAAGAKVKKVWDGPPLDRMEEEPTSRPKGRSMKLRKRSRRQRRLTGRGK